MQQPLNMMMLCKRNQDLATFYTEFKLFVQACELQLAYATTVTAFRLSFISHFRLRFKGINIKAFAPEIFHKSSINLTNASYWRRRSVDV